jgi:DNA-directed RNA polymerase specialized sigma24 family protein
VCRGFCPLVKDINGKGNSKEKLLSDINKQEIANDKDYNSILAEYAEDQRQKDRSAIEYIETMMLIKDHKTKAVKFLHYILKYNQREIANLFHVDRSSISRRLR